MVNDILIECHFQNDKEVEDLNTINEYINIVQN